MSHDVYFQKFNARRAKKLESLMLLLYNFKLAETATVFGGVDGSNPSLRRLAILLLICVGLNVFCVEPEALNTFFNFIVGGMHMSTISSSAVMFVIIKSFVTVLPAIIAGLVTNGVTPHL